MKWYVLPEYNDDDEPIRMYDSLKEVKKALYKSIYKLNDQFYISARTNKRGKRLLVFTKAGVIKRWGEKNALANFQMNGIIDQTLYNKHWESICNVWGVFADEHGTLWCEQGHGKPSPPIDAFNKHCWRLQEIVCAIKPASLEEVQ